MENSPGKLVAAAPLRRYIALRAIGMAITALLVLGFPVVIYAAVTQGITLVGVATFLLGALLFYLVSSLAFSRRAMVYQNGITPSELPFSERFALKSPILHRDEISEIRDKFAGKRLTGLLFKSHDGKTYMVDRNGVGDEVFDHFLEFKRRFYSD